MRTEVRLSVRGGEGMVVGIVHCPSDKFGSKRIINSKECYELKTSFLVLGNTGKYLWIVTIEPLEINIHSEESGNNYKT